MAWVKLMICAYMAMTTAGSSLTTDADVDAEFVMAALESYDSKLTTLNMQFEQYLGLNAFDADLDEIRPDTDFHWVSKDYKTRVSTQEFKDGKLVFDFESAFNGVTGKILYKIRKEGIIRSERPTTEVRAVPIPTRFNLWDKRLLSRLAEDTLVVEPDVQQVDGEQCYVVHGRAVEAPDQLNYRLYLAPSMGFLPVRVELLRATTPAGVTRVLRFGDYREIEPGLWFPYRVEEEGHRAASGEIFTKNAYVVKSLVLNAPVDDSLFELEFPPGTLVSDGSVGVAYSEGPDGLRKQIVKDAIEEVVPALLDETDSGPRPTAAGLAVQVRTSGSASGADEPQPFRIWRIDPLAVGGAAVLVGLAVVASIVALRRFRNAPTGLSRKG